MEISRIQKRKEKRTILVMNDIIIYRINSYLTYRGIIEFYL